MEVRALSKLPSPQEIKESYPINKEAAIFRRQKLDELKKILKGEDQRFILLIGPCSADREDAVLDYIERLKTLEEELSEYFLFIPRIYIHKPRTKGVGYKGLGQSPDPLKMPNLLKGIIAGRKLHRKVLCTYAMVTCDELLYPDNFDYFDDILAYVAVGARSVENQEHRFVASGLGLPVGMKNPTSGDLSVMMNGIYAAQHSQVFAYRGWEVKSHGNPYAHAILRGYTNKRGHMLGNYTRKDLLEVENLFSTYALKNPSLIVDCNHDNSGKNPFFQKEVVMSVLQSYEEKKLLGKLIKGFMIESYLEDGCQKPSEKVYGKSITDPCLGIEKTRILLYQMEERLSEIWSKK